MKSTDINHLKNVQYKNLDGLKKRWKTYEYLNPYFDIYGDTIKKLNLNGSEDILEVGCGGGEVLSKIAENSHKGRLVGLDLHENIFEKNIKNVEFKVGSADKIDYPDESFDVVLAFFMIYHLPDPLSAIKEWVRVLKKGGRLVITAGAIGNKKKLKDLKDVVAERFNKKVYKLTENCVFEKAEELVNSLSDLIIEYLHVYKSELHLPDTEVTLDAVDSVRDTFQPDSTDEEWVAIKKSIEEVMDTEIKDVGFYRDYVERGVLIVRK